MRHTTKTTRGARKTGGERVTKLTREQEAAIRAFEDPAVLAADDARMAEHIRLSAKAHREILRRSLEINRFIG